MSILAQTQIHTVKGGACVGANHFWCVLEKKYCPDRYDFVSARLLEKSYKNSPALECLLATGTVPIGQCTQERDKGICTGHKSNCEGCLETTDVCFQPIAASCELKYQPYANRSTNFTSFGLCVDPDEPDTSRHCLWSREECPLSYVWITPNTLIDSAKIDDICTCDKVQIGSCLKDSSFICAVSADSCDSEQEYIGAKESKERGFDCHLCKDLSIPQNATPNLNYSDRPLSSSPATQQAKIYSPAAGACVNDHEYWCALESSQCAEGYDFVSARTLEFDYWNTSAVKCLNQTESVPMGQCTQSIDKGLCTGHMSNCEGCFETTDICFQPNTEYCELQPTTDQYGIIKLASFGLCINEEKSDATSHCLWSRSECPSSDVWVTPNTLLTDSAKVEDFCTCDKVQIGACRYGDEYLCAVSGDACDRNGEYIGAKELTEYQPPIDCRLCKNFEMPKNVTLNFEQPDNPTEPPSPDSTRDPKEVRRYSVAAGACVRGSEYWCALDNSLCANGYNFVSARILNQEFREHPAIACIDQASVVPMGKCTQRIDDGLCTGHMSNCEGCHGTEDFCFQLNATSCALQQSTPDVNSSSFGLCINPVYPPSEGQCLWSSAECPATSNWVTPARRLETEKHEAVHNGCTCENVLVGACQFGNEYVCAVSEDACDRSSEYIGAETLRDVMPLIDCRLCITTDLFHGNIKQVTNVFSPSNLSTLSIAIIALFALATACLLAVIIRGSKTRSKIGSTRLPTSRITDMEGLVIEADGSTRTFSNASTSVEGSDISESDEGGITRGDSLLSASSEGSDNNDRNDII